ncbi:type III secretion system export apparatus subunit SctT [Endozoicomonas sp. SM1973]|uniref:Type III secretion system export apparatus subunit SctT n=1 Tax=Spartinivicinus marinus TaxID=2994442 RepID=A0A853IA95_9GAMM|nr:type III secretion system export apparatus subunit SctT [Spartinivicinus marinus]MCX4028150.1 type III secretion system export apparatus subunit SctT [Spartinivicinus marinus]NYZ66175.1 type III secretion system export apparatus subunit SctT [Spartinivicinus marinus]
MIELFEPFQQFLLAYTLSIPRVLVCLLIIPFFSFRFIKGMVRNAIVLGVALPVAFGLQFQLPIDSINVLTVALLAFKEAMIGLMIGYLLALPFWLFESVGSFLDNQRGALSGGYFNPAMGGNSSMLGEFLQKTLVILMIETGVFALFFTIIIDSFTLWPPTNWIPEPVIDGHNVIIQHMSNMMQKVVLYSAPPIAILFLIDLGFAILSLYSPQLQVYFLSMPAKSLAALIVLSLYSATLWYLAGGDIKQYTDLPKLFSLLFKTDGV